VQDKNRIPRVVAVAVLASIVFLALGRQALASDVTLFGANTFASLASSDGDGNNTVYTVNGNLVLASGASITCNDPSSPTTASACPIHIIVTGNMEMQPGSSIKAENNTGAGSGGNIVIEVGGSSFTLDGSVGSTPGALLSSKKAGGSDTAGSGDIVITVGDTTCAAGVGDLDVQAGAVISADGIGEAGAITIVAGHDATVDGTVTSRGTTTSGRGGPITIKACCDLLVGVKGVVSSRGQDPGADLVHLEGCAVEIKGLVESTGPGHQNATGKNLCNAPIRPDKPGNSTACVEIWSGTTIAIEGNGGNNGEVNADTGFSGGTQGTGWIDILANKAIAISGGTVSPYAVHANQGLSNGHGGVIAVLSLDGNITTSGKAVQANDIAGGGKGGSVLVQSGQQNVDFGAASIQANGSVSGGGGQAGGHITGLALLGQVKGVSPGELSAKGGIAPGNGTVTLKSCTPPAYTGAVFGALTTQTVCASPPIDPASFFPQPANTSLPASGCAGVCGGNLPPCDTNLPCQVPAKNPANVVTVTNCAAPPVTIASSWTQINLPGKDVVLQCALNSLPGTDGNRIIARSIKVDGGNGGSVGATGTQGVQLTASGTPCSDATIEILSTTVQSANSNANLKITACGDIVINHSNVIAGTVGSFGATLLVTSTAGRICADTDTFYGEHITLESSLDFHMRGSSVTSDSPLDYIRIISDNGSVFAGGSPTTPPCLPNTFRGGPESNLTVTAKGIIDLANACVDIAENITITAAGFGFDCANETIVNLTGAELRNDFSKPGSITVSACSNAGKIDITDAILVDTGASGGGVNKNAVASLNAGKKTTTTCPAISPNPPGCISRLIDLNDNPVCADEADRALHHVVGTPKVDR
jgi:hypothetical protein